MPATDETPRIPWRRIAFVSSLLTGVCCIALSIAWPMLSNGASRWSGEQAVAYQSAAAKLHQISMTAGATPSDKQTRALHDELAAAQAEYGRLRGELDAVREAPAHIATMFRYVGLITALAGTAGLVAERAQG